MLVKHNQDSSGMENHPWNHFIPSDAITLIIGTFPTAKRNWSFSFFYPNKRNLLWKILGEINSSKLVEQDDAKSVIERKLLLQSLRVGITDMGKRVQRIENSSLDEKLILIEPMDILGLLKEYPSIKKIILTSSSGPVSALSWFKYYLDLKNLTLSHGFGKKPIVADWAFDDRKLEVHILYSPSPRASNRISFPALVEMYKKVIQS